MGRERDMKLVDVLIGAFSPLSFMEWSDDRADAPAAETPAKSRTPEEAKARRKAYRKRKAAKAARRRNRR